MFFNVFFRVFVTKNGLFYRISLKNRIARAYPSRFLEHRNVFPIIVARGPVPRERSVIPGMAGDRPPPYG